MKDSNAFISCRKKVAYLSKEVSTLEYLSNIQPIDNSIPNDTKYMTFVHDPFALEQMAKMIETGRIKNVMTCIQAREMKIASRHCAFAYKDDYPWGTILVNGEKKVVCKCINRECSIFSQCRSGISEFSEEELETDKIGKKPSQYSQEILRQQYELGKAFKKKLTRQLVEDDEEKISSIESGSEHIYNVMNKNDEAVVAEDDKNDRDVVAEFTEWLINDGFFHNVIDKYIGNLREYDYLVQKDGKPSIFEDMDSLRLDQIVNEYENKLNGPKYRAAMKYYRKFVESQITKQDKKIEEKETDKDNREIKTKEIISQETKVHKEKDVKGILKDFQIWMLENAYSKEVADGYARFVSSVNTFARKRGIWKEDVFYPHENIGHEEFVNEKVSQLEKSPHFKSSMQHYIAALKSFAIFYSLQDTKIVQREYDTKSDANDQENRSQMDEKETVNEFSGDSFDKFIETEQDAVIYANPDDRIIVNAGPGTGKTYTLIEKLIYMVNDQDIDPEEILVLCFSRAAVDVIEMRLQHAYEEGKIGMNWHSIDIRTFDSFATHLLAYVAENEKELLYDGFSLDYLDYDERIKTAMDVVKRNNELIEQCTHLVVDEVQDLVGSRAKFVMQLITALPDESGYTLLGDACQSIYDYQIQTGEIDSVKFYAWLFKTQVLSKFFSFSINYRQISELEKLGNEYRNAIMAGDDKDRKNATNNIFKKIGELKDIDLKNVEYEKLIEVVGSKDIGILTRTNGQALKISTWFRNAGIPHRVQKRLTDNSLNVWIADLFRDYENDTIDRETFIQLYSEKGDFRVVPDDVWLSIEKTQYESKDRYYVRDLLLGILNNGKTKEFYTSTEEEQITISNIHRAKGREFDEIILLNDTLLMNEQDSKDIQEHKVSYVAVTRAKEKIYRTIIGTHYIKTDKNGDSRAYVTGMGFRKKKAYLSHIEVGRNYDLDPISFAESVIIQEKFDDPLLIVGERVKFVKNMEYSKKVGYISYDIVLEDDISFGRVGRTSKKFYLDLKRILKEINNLPPDKDIYPEIYPSRFSEIYVEDVISVISSTAVATNAGRKFGDVTIWKGITLVGLAQVERDKY